MYRNPQKVRTLLKEIVNHQSRINLLTHQLFQEKRLVPVGYRLMGEGEEVTEGCLVFNESEWTESTLAIGCRINENGYVYKKSNAGYLFASPLDDKDIKNGFEKYFEKEKLNGHWVCNECNEGTLGSWVTEAEIELEIHSCIQCGAFEFHFVEDSVEDQ